MKTYDAYLTVQDYSGGTIDSYLRAREVFDRWCNSRGYRSDTINYKGCLEYAKYLQETTKGKTLSKKTVKHRIGALKIYFNYLIEENFRGDSPFQNMDIRGAKRTLNHNLLDFEELEDLFYSYRTRNIELPSSPHVAVRNKVLTGLMVYQGLNATAFRSLKFEHINLERGRIYVPGTRKTNPCELEIKSQQILSLAQYLENDRHALQEAIGCHTEAFVPFTGDRYAIGHELFKKLRALNLRVKNSKQIRASVITHWLKHYNIREVQYMAGHCYISSTERYLQDNLEDLHEMIESLHPIS